MQTPFLRVRHPSYLIPTVTPIEKSTLDFERAFSSDSILAHAVAGATLVRAKGASGARHLPSLFARLQAVNLNQSELSESENRLVSFGAMSLSAIINGLGYDADDPLHADILRWILSLPSCRHIQIAGTSIHALALFGVPPQETRTRLEQLVGSARRSDDYPLITCRGTAFRCLAEIDRQLVVPYLGTPACADHVALLRHWLTQSPGKPNLIEELHWMTGQ